MTGPTITEEQAMAIARKVKGATAERNPLTGKPREAPCLVGLKLNKADIDMVVRQMGRLAGEKLTPRPL